MPYFFYLARCSDSSLYAGITNDLEKREETHNSGKGAKYTRAKGPVEIVYSEKFETQSEAMKREAEVKKWRKEEKEELLQT